jgi:spore coat polysaccharide biosynthesis predicted glycosyltransferase SpsG
MDTVLLRADGGQDIGMGHLMRCIALAEGCLQRTVTPVLITRHTDALQDVHYPEGMNIVPLPTSTSDDEDVSFIFDTYERHGPGPVVTDLCHEEYETHPDRYRDYLRHLAERVEPLVVIDDLLSIDFPSDVVINPGYGAEKWDYPEGNGTNHLLGSDYVIFRSEFIEQRKHIDPELPANVQEVVVTLGGSNQNTTMQTVCRTIDRLDAPETVHAISGVDGDSSWQASLQKGSQKTWRFSRVCNRMAEVLAGADFAITGGGLTKYETALLGVPSLVLSQVDHQDELMQEFQGAGTCTYAGRAGNVDQQELAKMLHTLSAAPDRLANMSRNGRNLVDEKGRERILDHLLS